MLTTCLLLSLNISAAELRIEKVADSVIEPSAFYFPVASWGNCVNGQAFQHDALTSFNGWQYATYYDSAGQLCAARRRDGAKSWEVIRFSDHHFKGNDTHNVAVIGICPADGTVHLSFDHHVSPLHYRVSRAGVALRPKDFPWTADLFGSITNELEPGKPLSRVTYPRFVRTPDGGLQFVCRIGSSGDGDKCLADYDTTSHTWKNFGAFVGGKGVYEKSATRNAYLDGLNYDRNGRLHVTWCWRESGDPMTNHDLDYAWSDDKGMTWFNNDGKKIGERGQQFITVDSPGTRVAEIPMNRGLINSPPQAVDSRNRIHVVTLHMPDALPRQADWESTREKAHYFHYWRDDQGKWRSSEMNFNGGRPQLWFDAADNAYLIFVGDRFNPSPSLSIAAATAKSGWTDWEIIRQEKGPFTGQTQIDRHAKPGVLSIYVQEEPKNKTFTSSALRAIEFHAAGK